MKLPTFKRGVLYGLGAIVILWLVYYMVVPFFGMMYGYATNSYSEGRRDIYVCKVAWKGKIKVWELEGFFHGQDAFVDKNGVPRGWSAVVEDEALAKRLDTFRGDELVRVRYRERYVRGWDTSQYLVTSADRLDDILPKNR